MWPYQSRYVIVGAGFKTLILSVWKSVFHKQPSDEDVELSAPLIPCLPGCCHVPALMIMDRTSEPVRQTQLKVVLISCLGHGVSLQQRQYAYSYKYIYSYTRSITYIPLENLFDCYLTLFTLLSYFLLHGFLLLLI